jgi:hypothetical protein
MIYQEPAVAALIGVGIDDIRTVRDLLDPDRHWQQHDSEVCFTRDGVEQALVALGISEKKLPATFWDDLKKTGGVEIKLPPREVVFLKATKNSRIVLCLDDTAVVRVQVRDARNFLRGMLLPVEHVAEDLFHLVGPLPRSRGRWN